MPADVNSDGVVDIADILLVGRYVDEDPLTYPKADVNSDGKVDIADIIEIIEIIESAMKTTTAAAASKHKVTGETGAAVSALYHKIETLSADPCRNRTCQGILKARIDAA